MTAVELPLLQRQAYVDGAWVDADSDGIGEWLELKYMAIGGLAATDG